jgi:hypothetical protein
MARNHETGRRNQGPVHGRWASDRDYRDRFAATHDAARRYERDRRYDDRDRYVPPDERYPGERVPTVGVREFYGREDLRRERYDERPYAPEPRWDRDERDRDYEARDRFAEQYEHERRLDHERRARAPAGDDRYRRAWPDDRFGDEYYRPDYDEYGRYLGDDVRARRADLRHGIPARARDFAADDRDSGRRDHNPHRFGGYEDIPRETRRGGHDRDEHGRFIGDDEGFRGFDDDRDREVAGFGGYGRDDDRRYDPPPLRRDDRRFR